jgi:hypothetical protein
MLPLLSYSFNINPLHPYPSSTFRVILQGLDGTLSLASPGKFSKKKKKETPLQNTL